MQNFTPPIWELEPFFLIRKRKNPDVFIRSTAGLRLQQLLLFPDGGTRRKRVADPLTLASQLVNAGYHILLCHITFSFL